MMKIDFICKVHGMTIEQERDKLREQVKLLRDAAKGLSFGTDWNNGTHAKIYRPKLLAALAATEPNP